MLNIGKIVTTHGIKGEIRIRSDIENKSAFFKVGNTVYVDNEVLTINSYRVHKDYDMITFKEYNDINDVIKFKNKLIYVNRDEINTDNDYVITDLIGYDVYFENDFCGKITDYMYNSVNYLLEVTNGSNHFYIPYNDNFIKKVDQDKKQIIAENIKDLIA